MVAFSGAGDEANDYAGEVFGEVFRLLPQGKDTGLSPVQLSAEATDNDCLARGLRLKSKFVLTAFARAAADQPPVLTARLYDVERRQFIWTENYDRATVDAATAAQRLTLEAKQRIASIPKEP